VNSTAADRVTFTRTNDPPDFSGIAASAEL
jgi:hypothetical protein